MIPRQNTSKSNNFFDCKKRRVLAKLVMGFISHDPIYIEKAKLQAEKKFGKIDLQTNIMPFDYTDYYENEFGKELKKKLCSFERLISKEKAYQIKKYSCCVEAKLSKTKNRRVNIDPGYVDHAKLVLFTTKDYDHRIYLGKDIWAEVTLKFNGKQKSFSPNEWTYMDYRTKEYIDFFNIVRDKFAMQILRG